MVFIGKWISNNENTIVFIPPVLPGCGICNSVRIHFTTQFRAPRDISNSLSHWKSHHLVLGIQLPTLISSQKSSSPPLLIPSTFCFWKFSSRKARKMSWEEAKDLKVQAADQRCSQKSKKTFFCSVCNITLSSLATMEIHLKGVR